MNGRSRWVLVAGLLALLSLEAAALGGPALPAIASKAKDGMLPCALDGDAVKALRCINDDLKFIDDWDKRSEEEMRWHREATAQSVQLAGAAWTRSAKPPDVPYLVAMRIAMYRVHPTVQTNQTDKSELCGVAKAALESACRLQVCGQLLERSRIDSSVLAYQAACGGDVPPLCSAPTNAACTAAYSTLTDATKSYAARVDALKIVPPELAGPGTKALADFQQALVAQRAYVDKQVDAAQLDPTDAQQRFVTSVGPAEFDAVKTVDSAVLKSITPAAPVLPQDRQKLQQYKQKLDTAKVPKTVDQYDAFKRTLTVQDSKLGASVLRRTQQNDR